MKLAMAAAVGLERQRWIGIAMAWQELAHIRSLPIQSKKLTTTPHWKWA